MQEIAKEVQKCKYYLALDLALEKETGSNAFLDLWGGQFPEPLKGNV